MRRVLKALLIAGFLGSAALAQGTQPQMYVGGSFGVVFVGGLAGVPIGAHFGFEDVGVPNLDVRASATMYVTGSGFEIGADALYNFPIQADLTGYAGAGPRFLFGGGGINIGLAFLGGVEYIVAPSVGVFGEAGANAYFAGPLALFIPGLKVGVNYHLP